MASKLRYIGSKLYVSHTGVNFGTSIDKYNYLQEVILLLDGVRNVDSNIYKQQVSTVLTISDDEILAKIISSDETKKEIETRMEYYNKKLNSESSDIDRLPLNELEKSAFKENLQFTKDDRLQRFFNKSVYHIAIGEICKAIFEKKIRVIQVPYTPDFNHIVYSIRNTLRANQPTLAVDREYVLSNNGADIVLKNRFTI
jgi:hypothetical protein